MVVFDAEILLSYYFGEEGSEIVGEALKRVSTGEDRGLINVVNLAEVWYVLARKDPRMADQKLNTLRSFRIRVVPVEDDSLWRLAAEIKSRKSIPLADAFAVATASHYGERLLVGRDKHFDGLGIDTQRITK